MYTYVYTYTNTCTYACMHAYEHTHAHIYTLYTHAHSQTLWYKSYGLCNKSTLFSTPGGFFKSQVPCLNACSLVGNGVSSRTCPRTIWAYPLKKQLEWMPHAKEMLLTCFHVQKGQLRQHSCLKTIAPSEKGAAGCSIFGSSRCAFWMVVWGKRFLNVHGTQDYHMVNYFSGTWRKRTLHQFVK